MTALDLVRELIAFPSVSTQSNVPVTDFLETQLKQLGFATERQTYFDAFGVSKANVIAKIGTGTGGLAYFAHSDVVPADNWKFADHGPFSPNVIDDRVYGRGSCDMKGSVACALTAISRCHAAQLKAPFYFVCTADEETGGHGAQRVAAESHLFQEMVFGGTRGIIGEPTRLQVVHSHKGVFSFAVTSRGRAAHSSTDKGINANLAMIPFLVEMKRLYEETISDPKWRNEEFTPSTMAWNIGINDHTKVTNITPPQSVCTVSFRPMPGQQPQELIERARTIAKELGLEFRQMSHAMPLFTDPHSSFVREALQLAEQPASKTVPYGTDGLMYGALSQLIVLGPGDIAQAHTHDEWIELSQLEQGTELYSRFISHCCL